MPEAVILQTRLCDRENLIGLGHYAEGLGCLGVARIDVRVMLARKVAEGLLDVLVRRVARHTKDLVVIARCRHSPGILSGLTLRADTITGSHGTTPQQSAQLRAASQVRASGSTSKA